MYDIKTVNKTLLLLKQMDYKFTKVSKITGIKVRTIVEWNNKLKRGIPLLKKSSEKKKYSKWTAEEKRLVIDYYFSHGNSISLTVRSFGYPTESTLKRWISTDYRYKRKYKEDSKKPIYYSDSDKLKIISDFVSRNTDSNSKAKEYNITKSAIYNWQKSLTGETIMSPKNNITKSKEELRDEINELRSIHTKLEMENKILKKANEILKKDTGTNYSFLTNKEKSLIVSSLKESYKLKDLILILNIKKSTLYYELKKIDFDKYEKERKLIKNIFFENYMCYGYRRLKIVYQKENNSIISEKVVRRIMKEENLKVYIPKTKKYSSYRGEISLEAQNIIKRNFQSSEPYKKALTDITEFSLKDGKVYLSPLIDCFTGSPITYKISKSPNTDLTNSMLKEAHEIIGSKELIIHSDRGFHYRVDSWIDLMKEYGYIRSMSKKGCSPDNSACEGFFGRIKNEFYYPFDWKNITRDQFIIQLDKYLKWFTNERIKSRLGYLNPKQFMINYNKTV